MNFTPLFRPSSILTGPISTRLKPWWLLPATAIAAGFPALSAHAAIYTWDGGTSGTGTQVGLAVNWTSDTLPGDATPDTALWNGLVAGNLVLSYTGGMTGTAGNKGIIFSLGASQTGNVIIDAAGGGTQSIRISNITVAAGAGALTFGDGNASGGTLQLNFGAGISNNNTFTWTNDSSNPVTLNSDVIFSAGSAVSKYLTMTGNGNWVVNMNMRPGSGVPDLALTKSGTGTLTISSSNSYGLGTTLNAGTLNVNNAYALGAGTSTAIVTINGGTLDNTSAGAITLANNNTQAWNGDFSFTGTKDLNLGTGAVTMNASRTVTVNGGTLTVGGTISGVGFSLTKAGVGTLALTGANLYSGTQPSHRKRLTSEKSDGRRNWNLPLGRV